MRSPSPTCCRSRRDTGPGGLYRLAATRSPTGSRCLFYGALLLFGLAGALGARAAELPRAASADPRPVGPTAPGGAAALVAPPATISPRAGLVDQDSVRQALAEASSGTTAVIAGSTALPAGTFRGFAVELATAAEPPPAAAVAQAAAGAPQSPPPLVAAAAARPAQAAGPAVAATPSPSGSSGGSGAPTLAAASGATGAAAVLGAAEATLGSQPSPSNPAAVTPASLAPASSAPAAAAAAAAATAAAASPGTATSPTPPPATPPAAIAAKPAPEPHPALGFDASSGVPQRPFGKLIYQIARTYALNPLLVAAIAKVESDFNPHARSRKGACGLMQVLPSTARRFGLARKRDLFNPRKNLETASRYLRWLVDRFGDDPVRVLAAYNAGEGAVDRFGGVPPFSETRDYVQRIFGLLGFSVLLENPVATAAVPVAAAASALAGVR